MLSQLAADHTLKKLKFTILVLIPCLLKGQLKKGTKQFCKNMDKTKNFGFVDFLILHLMYLDQPFFLIQSKFWLILIEFARHYLIMSKKERQ